MRGVWSLLWNTWLASGPGNDINIIPVIIAGPAISANCGKLRAPSLALDWQINRLIEVEARVSYHAGRWYEHIAPAFPLAHQLSGVTGLGSFSSIAVQSSGYDG